MEWDSDSEEVEISTRDKINRLQEVDELMESFMSYE